MTTTSFLQKYPDYYNSTKECILFTKNYNKLQSNDRYKNFCQINFTAGDIEQFEKYRYNKNNKNEINIEKICIKNNLFLENELFCKWYKYKNLNALSTINTFEYIFKKFKKGIFVKIVNNELKVFLPFSNVNFLNEWSSNIKIDPLYSDMYYFFNHISNLEGYKFNKYNINNFINTWYSNNSLIRYEYPINETDTNISCIKNMLEELCKNRIVPDIELFINKRDFPIITKNGYEPYYHLWDNYEKPLISNNYDKYTPILSMSSSDEFSDVLIPTYDDWIRIQSKENIYFPRASQDYNYIFNTKWENKKSIAVFRGSSTGSGVTIETNQRLKLVSIGNNIKNKKYLDVGITKWNIRPKKLINNPYLQTLDIDSLSFKLSDKLTPKQQSEYKYIIHVDGHVSALRLSYELSMNSVLLIVESKWKMWFSNLLIPYEHYIPVKEDLSDIIDIIKWCQNNDLKCKKIAKNGKEFYNKYLGKEGVFDYLQKLFIDLKKHMGNYIYNDIKPIEIQLLNECNNLFENEKEHICFIFKDNIDIINNYKKLLSKKIEQINFYPYTKKNINNIYSIPNINRTYGLLKGIHYIVNIINSKNYFETETTYKDIIFENKHGCVKKYKLDNFLFSVKTTNDFFKIKEHIHETYIGINCINNLLKEIPNFVYIFGIYKKEKSYNVITEYINGKTFKEYIKSENFNFKDCLLIILQLCAALQYAQKIYGFVHYDLTPWNIMIQYLKEPIYVDYIVSYNKVIRIKTHIVPIIIDYGKSHVFFENKQYGFINMYKFSTSNDILTLLITMIYQIITEKRLLKNDFTNLLKLANFMSNNSFYNGTFKNSKEMRNFFYNAKKYSNLIFSNKYELETVTPLDLFEYIINFNYDFPIEYISTYNSIMNKDCPNQIFEYILSNNDKSRLNSFLNIFYFISNNDIGELVYKIIPKKVKNKDIYFLYLLKELEYKLYSVYNSMTYFLKKENNKYENKFLKAIRNIKKNYISTHFFNDIELDILDFKTENYTENIFLFPEKVKEELNKNKIIDIENISSIIDFKNILEKLILIDNDKIIKQKQYKNILEIDSIRVNNNLSNVETLKFISEKILFF